MLHILLITVICAAGIGAQSLAAQDDGDFPRTVIDDSGADVRIPAYPARVAVIGAVPALDVVLVPGAVVQLDPADDLGAVDWADQRIGLLVLPDLYATAYPAWIESAAAAGVPVYRTAAITSVDLWRDAVLRLGAATGRDRAAQWAVVQFDVIAWAVRGWVGERDPVRVLVLTPEAYTVGQGVLLTDLIALAGGINVAAEAGYADVRQIDDAAMRALAPDVMLLTPAWGAEGRAALLGNAAYAAIPAVATRRVSVLPFDATRIAHPGAALIVLAVLLWR
ncbi:MAG: ABC transporter substrate-binding protein [Anaerolineae bacterium]|nr:ABC transporter substrate-binding protein [Anaerolineae bacterium]